MPLFDFIANLTLGLLLGADAQQAHLLDQTILQGLVGLLNAAFCLWGIGANQVNPQAAQGMLKLSDWLVFQILIMIFENSSLFWKLNLIRPPFFFYSIRLNCPWLQTFHILHQQVGFH